MKVPAKRLSKKELVWLADNNCQAHNHSYFSHYTCYLRENPKKLKIGFLDIEAYSYGRNFRAQDGLILCCSMKVLDGERKTFVNARKDILKLSDKTVMKNIVKELATYNKIFTYNGTRYDLPYIRTRAIINKLNFLEFGDVLHRDIYYIVRSKLSLKRSTQEMAGQCILGKSNKTHYSPKIWMQAMQGNQRCINLIVKHNIGDVIELEQIYNGVNPFTKVNNKSL